ncbi:MAG: prephenate dehydratase domain-containing protein [Pyrinomonadaceae bacterium]
MSLVAIQGIKGSYSEEATIKILGDAAQILECENFEDTFLAVENGNVEWAVIPVENKIVGEIETPQRLLKVSGLRILERLSLDVRHVLAGTPNAEFENLTSVRSHVEALKQCRRFLSRNIHVTQIIGADTASSVRLIIDEKLPMNAAIGSRRAAELYGAKILRENIADDIENWTTFYLIGN